MKHSIKARLSLDEYVRGVLQNDRVVLGQAITLIESNLVQDQQLTVQVIEKIIHASGRSIRIGITGVPGVGKSTFIEAFGSYLTLQGLKVAVLAIDPTSQLTKGSILGDKTRMEMLSKNPKVFIRASAAGNVLGGVASKTRESMLLCEAAGYDVVIIETVGVGQSETSVKGMVDFFLLLMLAGAGDELQGIKKGIIEMADALVITKADGDNYERARKTQIEFQHALQLLPTFASGWHPVVLASAAQTGMGINTVWETITKFKNETTSSGYFEANRKSQNIAALHDSFSALLRTDYERFSVVGHAIKKMEELVGERKLSPLTAAQELLKQYHDALRKDSTSI